ncbi:MAG: tetratricopeptide repeat protein [Verrucomicrobiae bacterium]|nr:tetratricopeptide repeat protein [Verrucomicrobiae bacterium]
MTKKVFLAVSLVVAVSLMLLESSSAGVATDMAERMEQLMQDSNFPKAAEVGERFEKDCPTGCDMGPDGVFKIRYNLAWCYYLNSDYPNAIKKFQELSSDKVPSEDLKQQAMQLVGDSYSRYAGSLQDPKDKQGNYKKAIDQYTKYIGQYPKSEAMADVLYGRGLAFFRIDKFDESAKDLRDLLERFQASDLILEAKYLLASVYGTHGSSLRKNNKTEEATKYLQAARDLFKEIIASSDIALANDAAYAAGEIFFQLKEYDVAISYYRAVRTRDEVLLSQQSKVGTIRKALSAAAGASDKRRVETLRNLQMKESSKLKEIQSSPDLLLAANMRVADSYFQQRNPQIKQDKFPEARIAYRFLLPHAKLGDREIAKQAAGQIVATYIGQGRPVEAKQAFAEFESDFGVDPLAEPFGLAIGDLFLRKGKGDEALEAVEKSMKDFPKNQYMPMLKFRRAQALDALQRSDEAVTQMDEVMKDDSLKKEAPAEIEYALGRMLRGKGNYDEAIKHFNVVIDKTPNFELIDDVHFQVALCFKGKGKKDPKDYDKAIELFRKFNQSFEGKSQLVVPSLYQVGQCYEAKDDPGSITNAVNTYRELAGKYPADKLAPFAQYQAAIVYYNREKWEEMVKGFQELIQKFPKDTLVCDAHFWIGFKFQRERNYPKAVEEFEKVVADCATNALASDALYRVGNSWQTAALTMGNYKVLDRDKQPVWRDNAARSMAAFERVIGNYPKSDQLNDTLKGLKDLQLAKIIFEVEKQSDVDAYFHKLAGQYTAGNPTLGARVLLCLASIYTSLRKTDDAIVIYGKAFQSVGDETLPAEFYDEYAGLLVDTKKYQEAINLYDTLEEKYKSNPQIPANAVWGRGNALLQAGQYEEAIKQFERLIKDFPWHPHAADAQFGKGLVLESQKKYDEALKIYEDVAVKLKGEARIRALLGLGRSQMAKGDCKSAVDNFQKVSLFYEKYKEFASEALWLGGLCFEKLTNITEAIKQYRELVTKYPDTKYVDDANKRLKELAAAPAAK